MIDIHCHILPGVDDGPEQLEHAMAMAEDAIADGITHVIATPHANSHYHFDYQRVRRIRGALQERLGDRLHVATGCDFHLSPENLAALKVDPVRFCLNQRNYLLVEFDEFASSRIRNATGFFARSRTDCSAGCAWAAPCKSPPAR